MKCKVKPEGLRALLKEWLVFKSSAGWISVMLLLECFTWHKDIWFQTLLHSFAICLGVVDCA